MRWIIVPVGYQFGLVGGPEKREIRLVPYQGGWPDRFRLERAQIVRALGAAARRVDHIGSTSVPGLMAKPIVDIDLSVADADDEAAYLPAMERAGYHLRVREPGHRLVRTAAWCPCTHLRSRRRLGTTTPAVPRLAAP